jgi:hypothetical protein
MFRRVLVTLALAVCGAATASASALAQPVVASGPPGATVVEFVGRIAQEGENLTLYGYLTHVRGLPDAALFSQPGLDQSEQTARFTISARARIVRRSVLDNIFATSSTGTLTIHSNPSGGNFDDPSTFERGTAVATGAFRIQNVISVFAPQQGLASATGELTQRSAARFSAAGRDYRFGKRGLRERVFLSGAGTLLDPALPRSVIAIAGSFAMAR